jgi:Zn-dependent peptidase ImmA (M78 family)
MNIQSGVISTAIPSYVRAKIADLLNTAPVDVAAVAKRLGLEIYESSLAEGVSGVLLRDESYGTQSGFVILVDDSETHVRQRFTAAHEIGHYVLHKDKIGDGVEDNYLLRSDGFSTGTEQQANRFAADLLMPYPLVQRIIGRGRTNVSELAKALQVSEVAMAIRLGHPT